MYGFDQDTPEKAGLNLLEVGIQEDVMLKKVAFDTIGEYPTLAFFFESASGAQFTHREFSIDPNRERQNAGSLYDRLAAENKVTEPRAEFIESRVKAAFAKQGSRIKHIATKFMEEQDAVVKDAPNFEVFCKKVEALFKDKLDDRRLRLLLVYNYKDYVSFPDVPVFIEVQTSEPTSLKITSKHRLEKKEAPSGPNPSSAGSASDDNDSFV